MNRYQGGIWALLILALLAGLFLHQLKASAWQMWWAVWFCEILTYILYAMFFVLKTPSTALAVAIGSINWYINQRSTAYAGEQSLYVLTFFVSLILVLCAYGYRERKDIPYVSKEYVNVFGAVALVVMMLFAVGKMMSWIPWSYDTAAFTSAEAWSFGQFFISLGGLMSMIKLKKENEAIPLYIAGFGLVIALFAALAYGIALALL